MLHQNNRHFVNMDWSNRTLPPIFPVCTCMEAQGSWNCSHTSCPHACWSSRWAPSVKLCEICSHFNQPAPSPEHLCKHRATAAKHRCWQTVNTPEWTMCCFQNDAELSSCAFSSSGTEKESRWVATGKIDRINNPIYFPLLKAER